MKLALLALALLATPAAAKTWVNDDCSLVVASGPDGFVYETTDAFATGTGDDVATLCTVKSWPVSSPIATMACDNGTAPKMSVISDDEISFDGQIFTTTTDRSCFDE